MHCIYSIFVFVQVARNEYVRYSYLGTNIFHIRIVKLLNFVKGTVLGDKEQGVGIRVKGLRIRDKT